MVDGLRAEFWRMFRRQRNGEAAVINCMPAKARTDTMTEWLYVIDEPQHDKTNKMSVRLTETQISLGIRPVWSESWLSARRKLGSLANHWAHSEDSDHIGRMPRLIWVFAGRTRTLLVLSCRGSDQVLFTVVGMWPALSRQNNPEDVHSGFPS